MREATSSKREASQQRGSSFVNSARRRTAPMKRVFEMLLSSHEADHLKWLAQPAPFLGDVRDNQNRVNNNFKMELEHLLTLKLIEREKDRGLPRYSTTVPRRET